MTSWILILAARRPQLSAPTRRRGQQPASTPGALWAGRGAPRGAEARIPGGAWAPLSPAPQSLTLGVVSGAWVCRPPGVRPWCLQEAPPPLPPQESSQEATPGAQGALLLLQGETMATMILGELLPIQKLHPPKVHRAHIFMF